MAENPFELLGLPERFALDPADLQRRFLTAAAATHPDRFLDPLDQADAAARAAAVNHAYRVLQDPAARAEALLTLWSDPVMAPDQGLPADLLAEVMERREALDEARAGGDAAGVRAVLQWAAERSRSCLERIAALCNQMPQLPPPERAAPLRALRRELNALRYLQRLAAPA